MQHQNPASSILAHIDHAAIAAVLVRPEGVQSPSCETRIINYDNKYKSFDDTMHLLYR